MESKICKQCKENKPLTDYDKIGNHIRVMCKKCRRLNVKLKRQNNPVALEKNNACKARIRLRHKQRIVDFLGGKCSICGLVDIPAVYDTHHINPQEKDTLISSLSLCSWESIQEELVKCILVCSNCHRKLHVEQRATLKKKKRSNTGITGLQ